jgi:phosphoglycolate phosphatase
MDSIIFDLDGTIWDSADAAAVVWKDVASKYAEITDKVDGPTLKSFYGLPLEDIARNMFKSVPEEFALKVMEECVVKQCPYLEQHGAILLGDVEATLIALKKKYKLFIVSNCKDGYIQAFLKAHDLEKYFDDFECPGRTGELKAANIRIIMERNHLVAPVYVGDTEGDYIATKEVGLPFVYARYGFGEVKKYDYVIDAFEELKNIF